MVHKKSFFNKNSHTGVTKSLFFFTIQSNLKMSVVQEGCKNSRKDRTCERVTDIAIFFFCPYKGEDGKSWMADHPSCARFFLFFVEGTIAHSPPLCSSPFPKTANQKAILTTVWPVSVFAVTNGLFLHHLQGFPVDFFRKWSLFIPVSPLTLFLNFFSLRKALGKT